MTIKFSPAPQEAKSTSRRVIYHRRELDDEEESPEPTGGMTVVYMAFVEPETQVVALRVAIAMCRHDEAYNKKLGVQIANGRLLSKHEDTMAFNFQLEAEDYDVEVRYDKDGYPYLFSEPKQDDDGYDLGVLPEVLTSVDDWLEANVWPNIHTHPNNPLDYEDMDLEGLEEDDDEMTLVLVDQEADDEDDDDSEDDADDEDDEDEDAEEASGSDEDPVKH